MELRTATPRPSFTRRRFLAAGLFSAAGLALYSGEVERHWIETSHHEIRIANLPQPFEGMRIAQISDIHMEEYTEPWFLRTVVDQVNALQPDAVFLTGDFVSEGPLPIRFSLHAAERCAEILSHLICPQRYACMGNHDALVGEAAVTAALTASGVTVLNNAYLPLERPGGRIWLAAVDDPLKGSPDPEAAIPPRIRNIPDEPVFLLCHGPDFADDLLAHPAGSSVAFMLSGHTHGGQVRIPWIGPVGLPLMGQKYVEGWFRLGAMQLYVNRGIGTVKLPFRFNCPPEISLFTLHRG